jgi:hypothetical protein
MICDSVVAEIATDDGETATAADAPAAPVNRAKARARSTPSTRLAPCLNVCVYFSRWLLKASTTRGPCPSPSQRPTYSRSPAWQLL